MKIIFLDIDGVLNNTNSMAEGVELIADKLIMLRILCEELDAYVVISSTWRKGRTVEYFQDLFQMLGFYYRGRIIGLTPTARSSDKDFKGYDRGYEIEKWLNDRKKKNWETGSNEVIRYCVVDDDSDMLDSQLPYFVHVNRNVGLCWMYVEEIRNILK